MERSNDHSDRQPPPGYPTVAEGGSESPRRGGGGRATARGRKTSFIDACVAALCCCWLCDLCCE